MKNHPNKSKVLMLVRAGLESFWGESKGKNPIATNGDD